MRVQVTQKHIDEGQASHCERCPIALAMLEQYPVGKGRTWYVDGEAAFTGGNHQWLPLIAQDFIHEFDENGGDAVGPFDFDTLDYDPRAVDFNAVSH